MSDSKIAKLEAKVNEIMARPTYAVTPAWQAEVAEIRVQIESLRTGQEVERREYQRPKIGPGGAVQPAMADGATADVHDHDHDHEHPPYMAIFVALLVLTVLEWKCAPWFGIGGATLWVVLTVMAVVKALMVALYFMHLKMERRLFHSLLILPIILVILMLALVSPDAHQSMMQYLDFLH